MNGHSHKQALQGIAAFIREGDDFAVICHERPDGDALGSMMGLTNLLRSMGKRATPVCADPVPAKYAVMPQLQGVHTMDQLQDVTHIICVDTANIRLLGTAAQLLDGVERVAAIDHHPTHEAFGRIVWVDPECAATGEMILTLADELDVVPNSDTAQCLLLALSTDTGHFHYSNTKPVTMRCAARLMEAGADIQSICQTIYRRRSLAATRLLGRAIENMILYARNRVALMCLTQADFTDCGATLEQTEGVIDLARDIDTVQIAVLLREHANGTIRGSIRMSGDMDAAHIAAMMGGGGHRAAAGFSFDESVRMPQAIQTTLDAIDRGASFG